ncbi:MAG: helix-turn-helix domain-containing protein [Nakamurella sp.]
MTTTGAALSKTARTRARLLGAAIELFGRQGYEQTTVGQIASAAGVSEMTFYRYFGSKVQLLIDDPYDPLIAAAIGEQPKELAPLARTVRGIRLAWRRLPITDDAPVRARVAIVAATPSLLPAVRASSADTESAMTHQLVADGADATDAAVAAAAVMAALMTGLMHWALADGGSIGAAVERALDVLEPNDD